MRRPLALLALLASVSASACFGGSPDGAASPCDGPNPNAEPPLAAGTVVDGVNAAAWLSPYWGTYGGTLTWAAGGQTTVTLTSSPNPTPSPIFGECVGGAVPQVFTYGIVVLTSGDGGLLNDTAETIVGAALPGSPNGGSSGSSPISATAQPGPWQASLESHLAIDVARYAANSYLLLDVDWSPGADSPMSATLQFVGSPLQAPSQTDTILVASMTFP
jgi:hypothetical protein